MSKTKIKIPRGATYKLTLLIFLATGERFTDATATVKAYAKRRLEQDYYDIELTGNYTGTSEGVVWVFTFSPETTANLAFDRYFFEIRVDGTTYGGGTYSYVVASVSDTEFFITPSVLTPATQSAQPSILS